MIEKTLEHALQFSGKFPIEALNRPQGWDIFENGLEFSPSKIKLASSNLTSGLDKTTDEDLGGYDLKAGVEEHPDHLFVKVLAIKKDEPNDNGDAFNEEELKKATQSFIGCPLFCNHANDDIEKARGKVVHAWYDDKAGGIWTINMVDKVAYPKLARGIEEGYINGTSMGCQVQYSLCSICHNKAAVADEYCDHVKNRKTKKFSGKAKCKYHDSKCKPKGDDECPVCHSTAKDAKEATHKEALIHEWNYGLKFIEDSFVVNPACHDCLVDCILNVPEMNKESGLIIENARKVAGFVGLVGEEELFKVASSQQNHNLHNLASDIDFIIKKVQKIANSPYTEKLFKVAGKIEIDNLNKAMKFMEVVAKSMMDQKELVSMDYVSDLVEVFAKLQTVTDELVEMGYANIQSPPTLQDPNSLSDAAPLPGNQSGQGQSQPFQTQPQAMQPKASPQPQPQGGATTGPMGDVGSVTKPTHASGKIEELHIASENNDGIRTTAKESEQMPLTNTNKTAAAPGASTEQHHKTIEKQLADAKLEFHPRTGESPDGVTESKAQLGGAEQMKDVDSDSPQVRTDEYPNITTDGQLDEYTGTPIARWNKYPDTILEKNWTEFSRAVGSKLTSDQKDHTTEAQLQDLLSHHRWTEPVMTTENQLASKDNWANEDNAWLSKSASVRSAYSKAVVTAAINTLVDTIADYSILPNEVANAARYIGSTPHNQIKAAFLTLINGMPGKKASRQAEIARNKYFGKQSSVTAVDAVLACAGDNCLNLRAEDLVAAIQHIASDNDKINKIESKAKAKLSAKYEVNTDSVVDKFAAFDEAFNEIEPTEVPVVSESSDVDAVASEVEDDGLYGSTLDLDTIGVSLDDEDAFRATAEKLAKEEYPDVDAVLYSIDIDDANHTAEVVLKDVMKLTASEKKAVLTAKAEARARMTKEAQGMGGEMGGGMGAPGGAPGGPGGTTMPTPPGAEAAPAGPGAEALTADPAAGDDQDGDDTDAEAKPPGSICPCCGSQDVDIVAGKGRCNNEKCGAEFVFKVQVDVTKWPGVNDTNEDDKDKGDQPDQNEEVGDASEDGTGDNQGEGFAMPDGGQGADANIPVAAMTRLSPAMITRLASDKSFELGKVSPLTGSKNTYKIANGQYLCMDTGRQYQVAIAIDKKDPKSLYAEWRWTPKLAAEECSSCRRAKTAWSKALKTAKVTEMQFDEMSFRDRADTILAMHDKGMFSPVKTASKNLTPTQEIKLAYATPVFPMDECRAKIAKRYGENAIAISGPEKGKKLADCVCNQLKSASVYSDGLALKVADTWKDKDACVECVEDYIRLGYDFQKAAKVCEYMKLKFASGFELFAEELTAQFQPHHGQDDDSMGDPAAMGGDIAKDIQNAFPDDSVAEVDVNADPSAGGPPSPDASPVGPGAGPAEGGMDDQSFEFDLGDDLGGGTGDISVQNDAKGHGTVSIDLPLSTLDALEDAIDSAHGRSGEEDAGEGLDDGDKAPTDDDSGDDDDSDDNDTDDSDDDDDADSDDGMGGMGFGGDDDKSPDDGDSNPFADKGDSDGDKMEEKDKLASYMRKGKISSYGEMNLDLSALAKEINYKKAGDSKLKQENAQDAVDGYTAGNGSIQGSEEKFKADLPKVPRSKATIGDEQTDWDNDGPQPTVPHGGGEIGHEAELGYTSEDLAMTGGANGAGKTETTNTASYKKTQTSINSGRQVTVPTKKADKLSKPKPVSETSGLDVPRSHKDHALTPEKMKRTPFSDKDLPEIPQKGEGARIGGEVDMGSVPKATEEYNADIPVGGSKATLKNEEKSRGAYAPEKQTERSKGTVSANGGNKSRVEAEAVRIAGRMVEARKISPSQLLEKIAELKQYELPTLKMIEATLFTKATKKGLATEPDGVEQAVRISEASSTPKSVNSQDELVKGLHQLFRLHHKNEAAAKSEEQLGNAEFRRIYNR